MFILIRCIDVNQHIQFVRDLLLQDQMRPSGSNFDKTGQSNPFLKSMATPHEFELPCDIIISPPHSFFIFHFSESFFE